MLLTTSLHVLQQPYLDSESTETDKHPDHELKIRKMFTVRGERSWKLKSE
jgi:hypothetical protein